MKKKSNLMLKLANFVIKMRIPIILLVLGITVFFGLKALNITIESDIIDSLPDDDEASKFFKDIGDKYEGNSSAMVILETENVFDTTVLNDVQKITDSLQNIEGVSYVTSVTNVIDIKSSEWGIEIGKLVDPFEMPKTQHDLDSLRDRVFEKDMYHGILISDDSTTTVIVATLTSEANRDTIIDKIKANIAEINPREKVLYAGIPFMIRDVKEIIVKDLFTLLPITAVIIIIILFFGFRSARGVVLPLLTVMIAIIWTLGLMATLGYDLTVISDTIPIIIFALGSAYTIHALNRINKTKDENPRKALTLGLAYIIVPIFLAFLTTAFGFMSFVFGAYLIMIKDFGIFTAIGITFAFILSVTFTPALIAVFGNKRSGKTQKDSKMIGKFLQPLSKRVTSKPKLFIALWFGITVISISGIFFITKKVDIISYFKKDTSTRISQDILDKKLGGASPFYLVFEGDVQSPELLQEMKKAEDFLKNECDFVDYALSVADLVSQMNDAMGEGDKIPQSKEKIEQLWMLIESEEIMPQIVNSDLTEGIIQARFASLDSRDSEILVEKVNKYVAENTSDDIKISFAGMPVIYEQIGVSLINSQLSSIGLAIILMLIIISLTLWSFKDGILTIIPLILTILISFGFMGLTGIPLDIATVLVASVTLGVGIDYSVHIITHYRNFFTETKDTKLALEQTILTSGNAIIINVLAVTLGFSVFMFSSLVPLNNFGMLMALSMIVSAFAALTLLPALIVLFKKVKK